MMKIGDLVSLSRCDECLSSEGWLDAEGNSQNPGCMCGMCTSSPTQMGIVTEKWIDEDDSWSYICEFDVGQQVFRESAPKYSHFTTNRLQVMNL